MKAKSFKWAVVLFIAIVIIAPFVGQAEVTQDMTQGQFALWLVQAIGALDKLPPAATADDAVDFLLQLGVYPEGGWKKDEKISTEFLASLLGDDSLSSLSFEELLKRVLDHVQTLFNESHLGTFRAFASSSSGSAVAG